MRHTQQTVKCANCIYPHKNMDTSVGKWRAITCGNVNSPYFSSLLNTDANGNKHNEAIWGGCEEGKPRPAQN